MAAAGGMRSPPVRLQPQRKIRIGKVPGDGRGVSEVDGGGGVDVGLLVGCGPYEWVSQGMAAMEALWAWRSGVKNLNVGMRIS